MRGGSPMLVQLARELLDESADKVQRTPNCRRPLLDEAADKVEGTLIPSHERDDARCALSFSMMMISTYHLSTAASKVVGGSIWLTQHVPVEDVNNRPSGRLTRGCSRRLTS